MLRWGFVVWITVILVLRAPAVAAQSVPDGSIRGVVQDEQAAVLPGASVSVTSPTTSIVYAAVSDDEGLYRLLNLPPGQYTLTAKLPGFAEYVRENIVVRAGLNLSADIVLKVGALTERVDVKLDSPMLETSKPTQAVNISGDFQRSLPLSVRHSWADFLYLAPGLVSTESTSTGNFMVNGSDFGSHVIQLDGADIAASAQGSVFYINMSSEVLQDVQVKTGGVDASAPLGQGAVINMVSRSGTNTLHGSALTLVQNKDWAGNNNPGGTTSAYTLVQPEASLGGPVVRDKSWLFGSYRGTVLNEGISRSPAQLAAAEVFAPGFEPFDRETRGNQVFVKSTTQLGPSHQLQGFYQYGRDKSWFILPVDTVASRNTTSGGYSYNARLSSVWNGSLTTRAGFTFADQSNPDVGLKINDKPGRPIYQTALLGGGRLQGSNMLTVIDNFQAGLWQEAPADKATITLDATYFKNGWMGTHEFQAGTYLQPRRLNEFTVNYANGGFAVEDLVLRNPNDLTAGAVPFHRQVYDTTSRTTRSVNSKDYAFYLQDAWQPRSRLTISAGLRVDKIERRDQNFDVVVQDTLAIGPRLGVSYGVTADQKNIVRATYNRVHDAVSTGGGVTAGSGQGGFTDFFDLDLNGTFETSIVTPFVSQQTLNRVIDLDEYRQPRLNEYTVGFSHQFPGQVTADVTLVRRDFRDRTAAVEVNGIYENGRFVGYHDQSVSDINKLTSNVYNWPVYTGLDFVVTKETEALTVMATYSRQWRHLGGTWQPNDPASYIQPDAFANDKGIGWIQSFTSVTYSSYSALDQSPNGALSGMWRDHAFRVAVMGALPWKIRAGGNLVYQTGMWSGPIIANIGAPDPQFGPPMITLSNGRAVSNPLATPLRFAFPTRGDGQFKTPNFFTLSTRVSRVFGVGSIRIEPALDLLNVTNHDADQLINISANQNFSSSYGTSTFRQVPRSAQLSLRVAF